VRIWGKEIAVARTAHRTALVVADGGGSVLDDEVMIHDLGAPASSRLARVFRTPFTALRKVLELRPALIHFHDPELLPVGLVLRLLGYSVIYDVHEDVPRQVLDKYWLPTAVRRPVSWAMSALEWLAGRAFTAIVVATPTIARRFPVGKTVTIQNFPQLSEFLPGSLPHSQRPMHFVYTGALARIRGAGEMVHAAGCITNKAIRLQFAGAFRPAHLQAELATLPGWAQVNFHGWVSRPQVARLLGQARAGLVVLHPTRSYVNAFPIKMFEYMAAGLPVIASDFPLWRSIISRTGCGLLVDPLDPQAIADAMQWIAENPDDAQRMGERGRQATVELYNWDTESAKLRGLYNQLLP
jgi:glycosyltransferase involved in cell wall biosynthesis